LYEKNSELFDEILQKMKERVPGIGDISPESTSDGRLLLKFRDGSFKDPFIDRYVSDGTIKMFAYLVLLHDPKPHPLLCVEEPENQLYPRLMAELAEEFRDYSRNGGQVFVSTHSPDFLNALQIEEVFWLSKTGGYTSVHRAKEDAQLMAYMEDGDQMGYLWKQGFFKDVDPQ
jgi:predicted ATPase